MCVYVIWYKCLSEHFCSAIKSNTQTIISFFMQFRYSPCHWNCNLLLFSLLCFVAYITIEPRVLAEFLSQVEEVSLHPKSGENQSWEGGGRWTNNASIVFHLVRLDWALLLNDMLFCFILWFDLDCQMALAVEECTVVVQFRGWRHAQPQPRQQDLPNDATFLRFLPPCSRHLSPGSDRSTHPKLETM